MVLGKLEGVDDPEDLVEVAAGAGWVGEGEADGLVGADDEDRANGVLAVSIRVDHVIEGGNLAVAVGDDGEVDLCIVDVVDVFDPAVVVLDGIDADGDGLDVAFVELAFESCNHAELGGANGGIVSGV